MMSTGEPRVPSPQLRTRDNADHAGLSPPPVPLRELCSFPLDNSNLTLSNNSLTAPSRTTVATEVSWTTPSNTLRLPHSCSRLTTHTREETDTAPTLPPRVLVRSRDSRMSPETPLVLNSELPSPRDQSPLPSRLINSSSRDTEKVSSPTDAEANSTTVSSLSDTVDSVTW